MPSLNTKLASAPNTQTNYVLKATSSTTIGNSLIFDNGTNVGIGNTNTTYTLDVTGTIRATGSIFGDVGFRTKSLNGYLLKNDADSANLGGLVRRSYWAGGAALDTQIFAETGYGIFLNVNGSSTTGMTITSAGNVLIGSNANSADTSLLTIKQASTSFTNGIYLERGGERNGYFMYIGGALDALTFRRNYFGTQSDVMSLTRDGNVGIGTSSPDNLLDLYGTGTNTTRIRVRGTTNFALFQAQNDSSSALYMGIDSSTASGFNVGNYSRIIWSGGAYPLVFATNDIERMRIASDGWVTFQGNGNGWTIGQASNLNRIDNTGSTFRCLGTNNGFTAIAASAFNVNSDYRLKEDLKDFNNSLDIVKSIKIYDFKWKDREERNYGVIAHELQEVLPYLVYGEKDGMEKNGEIKTQGVDYGKLVPVLVKAIQEQQAQIEELKALINK